MLRHSSKIEDVLDNNQRLFKIMSIYLNLAPDYITKDMIEEITGGDSYGVEFAFANLAAAALGIDVYGKAEDKAFFHSHFYPMFKHLDISPYINDPYYKNIVFPSSTAGRWSFDNKLCRAYEAFVYDDPRVYDDGRVIPSIGFFDCDYSYPAVCEGSREWMTLMPNEINTTTPAVRDSRGKVLTYGLGLGYFTYMAHLKPEVDSVTVVEISDDAIDLFKTYILPQFPHPDKINIIKSDAFEYAENIMGGESFDFVFVDLWHDPSDGCELYLRMKQYEDRLPCAKFVYWVEDTLKLYL